MVQPAVQYHSLNIHMYKDKKITSFQPIGTGVSLSGGSIVRFFGCLGFGLAFFFSFLEQEPKSFPNPYLGISFPVTQKQNICHIIIT